MNDSNNQARLFSLLSSECLTKNSGEKDCIHANQVVCKKYGELRKMTKLLGSRSKGGKVA